MVIARTDLRYVPDGHDRLTVWNSIDANVNINEVSFFWIDDPARLLQIVVVAAVNVMPAIKLRTTRISEFVAEFMSAVVSRDSPQVNASDEIWW